jgi:hypothetical protein
MASTNAIWAAIPFIVQQVSVAAGSQKRAQPAHLISAGPLACRFPQRYRVATRVDWR